MCVQRRSQNSTPRPLSTITASQTPLSTPSVRACVVGHGTVVPEGALKRQDLSPGGFASIAADVEHREASDGVGGRSECT